jgi:hypothetical protein
MYEMRDKKSPGLRDEASSFAIAEGRWCGHPKPGIKRKKKTQNLEDDVF